MRLFLVGNKVRLLTMTRGHREGGEWLMSKTTRYAYDTRKRKKQSCLLDKWRITEKSRSNGLFCGTKDEDSLISSLSFDLDPSHEDAAMNSFRVLLAASCSKEPLRPSTKQTVNLQTYRIQQTKCKSN
jgi:uncharacterized protein involved in type VI secretion and phage assembly